MSTALRSVLPVEIALSETTAAVDAGTLLPAEFAFVRGSVPKRRADFATGRHCAHAALSALGVPGARDRPIEVGAHRQPVWPKGVVGSITHCDGHYAAAAAHTDDFRALGIDVEVHVELADAIVRETSLPREWANLPAIPDLSWPTVLFSAREAVFKAWYPRVGTWLGYHDVEIDIDPSVMGFDVHFVGSSADVAAEARLSGIQGAVNWSTSHVFSGAWVRQVQP